MADISIINKDNTDYKVKDAAGRLALAEVENKGAKNLLKNTRTTTTHKGITFTINDDGSVTANGTNDNTGASVLDINTQTSLALSNGDYILTGCPAGGSDSGYMMDITRSPGSSIKDTGSGATFTVGGDYTVTEFRIVISRNVTVDNLKFYPMICTKAEWDISQAYVPYGKTNAELTSDISALSTENTSQQSEIDYAINTGAKNLVWYDREAGSQYTTQGRTFTVLSDGGIKITGNNVTQNNADFYLNGLWTTTNVIFDLSDKDYYISLSDNIGSTVNGIMFRAYNRSTGSTVASYSATLAERQSILKDKITTIFITITTAVTLPSDGIIVYPMIRPASITDDTFVPYALPNPVLTQEVNWNVNNGVKNLFDINTSLPLKIYHTTYTLSDGSLTVTSNGSWGHHSVPVNLPAGNYIFTTTISNFSKDSSASATSVRMRVTDTTATGGIEIASKAITGNGAFELPFTWTGGQCYIQYYPNYTSTTTYVSSFTASNNMIRPAKITDPTYEPYALPNPTLTPAAIKAVDEGAKNLFPNYATSQTVGGVTFTVSPDGSITSNGTKTNNDWLMLSTGNSIKAGTYVLSDGIPIDTTDCKLIITTGTSLGTAIMETAANARPKTVTLTSDYEGLYYAIRIASGKTVNNLTFKPMICTAQDWAVSKKFVPYAPSNRELYEKVDGLGTELVANTNLNNLNIGTYYCGGATIGATLLNSPTHQPFRLIVSYFQSPTNMMQKIIDFNTSTSEIAIYIRVKTSSGWKSWYKFEGTEVT